MGESKIIVCEFEQVHGIISLRRSKALQNVNNENLLVAWEVGAFVSARLKDAAWGSKTITQLSEYLRAQDPTLRGYSRRNIYNMVALYESYSSQEFLQCVDKLGFNEFMLPMSRQLQSDKFIQIASKQIVQFQTAQFPVFLASTTLTNHFEILNSCKTIEERVFYVLYSYKERLNI
jgi:hypothetical protein